MLSESINLHRKSIEIRESSFKIDGKLSTNMNLNKEDHDGVVCMLIRLWIGRPKNRAYIPSREKEFIISP
jgi:hypothetical protein